MAKILIADDSIVMRRNLKTILTRAGHEVIAEVANGYQACVEYEKCKPDLVTMDITMPIMDGIEAVKKIIIDYPEAKIVMISALDQKSMVFEALKNGAKHYVIKPITTEKVIGVINEVLEGKDDSIQVVSTENKSEVNNDDMEQQKDMNSESKLKSFYIENRDGIFVININKNMNSESFSSLSMAIQGFLFIKPLKMIFDFGEIDNLDEDVMMNIKDVINDVRNAEGEVQIKSINDTFLNSLKMYKINLS
jgi:DNA-binding NarL/FixJ family response regulator